MHEIIKNKKLYLGFILSILALNGYASAEATLLVSVKGNNICIFTGGDYTKVIDNKILFYMGEVVENQGFSSSYTQTYTNLKNMPTSKNDCISIDLSNFKSKVPYYLYLESDRSYSQRVCINKIGSKTILTKVKDIYHCGIDEYDYAAKSWWRIILSWLGFD